MNRLISIIDRNKAHINHSLLTTLQKMIQILLHELNGVHHIPTNQDPAELLGVELSRIHATSSCLPTAVNQKSQKESICQVK